MKRCVATTVRKFGAAQFAQSEQSKAASFAKAAVRNGDVVLSWTCSTSSQTQACFWLCADVFGHGVTGVVQASEVFFRLQQVSSSADLLQIVRHQHKNIPCKLDCNSIPVGRWVVELTEAMCARLLLPFVDTDRETLSSLKVALHQHAVLGRTAIFLVHPNFVSA